MTARFQPLLRVVGQRGLVFLRKQTCQRVGFQHPARLLSSGTEAMVKVETDPTDDKIRIMTLNRPPVNSLSLEFLAELIRNIDELEKEALETNLNGVIITSSSKSIFSAGLDLNEMLNPDKKR